MTMEESRSAADVVSRQPSPPSMIPTFGVFCLLAFLFVIITHRIAIGEYAVLAAFGIALFRPTPFRIPPYFRCYIAFFAMGVIGFPFTRYPDEVLENLLIILKVIVVGIAIINIITTKRDQRSFVIGYLLLFALFPVRGALYNYANGITAAGRISWNFFFSNPNDLAITCFLPLGLCGYIFLTESGFVKKMAALGMPVLLVVQLLTQSRGAVLGLVVGLIYFIVATKRRVRTVIVLVLIATMAVLAAPQGVWDRMAGLSKAKVGGDGSAMAEVDPEGSASGRWTVMGIALGIALENPLFGIGMGAYAREHDIKTQFRTDLDPSERGMRDAHSMYLRAAAETGLVGGGALIAFVLMCILNCRRTRLAVASVEQSSGIPVGLLALEASMVAYAAAATFNSAGPATYTILQYVVPCAIARLSLHDPANHRESQEKRA